MRTVACTRLQVFPSHAIYRLFCPCTYFTTEMCAVALTVSAAPKGSVRKNTATEVRAKVESETLRKDSYWQEGQYIGRMVQSTSMAILEE